MTLSNKLGQSEPEMDSRNMAISKPNRADVSQDPELCNSPNIKATKPGTATDI